MSQDIKNILNLFETMLTEAPNYSDMFNDIRKVIKQNNAAYPDHQFDATAIEAEINQTIAKAKASLKKSDRVVWFLRLWKMGLSFKKFMLSDPGTQLLKKLISDLKIKNPRFEPDKTIWLYNNSDTVLNRFAHWFSLPVNDIQNLTFEFQTWEEIRDYFANAERVWQERATQLIPHEENDGEVILKFPDGFFWQHLPRGGCGIEGKAMGHCGNVPSQREGDTILSLRQIVKDKGKTFVRPSLTFILDKDGMLGEMKGRNNNPPDKKYYPHIVSLLKLPIIKGIKGGGYKPENNFRLSKLDDATHEELLKQKPELGSLLDYYKMYGYDKRVESQLKDNFNFFGFMKDPMYEDTNLAIIERLNSIDRLIKYYGDKETKYYINYLNGEDFYDYEAQTSEAKEFFSELPTKTFLKIIEIIKEKAPDAVKEWEESNDEKIEDAETSEVFELLQDADDEIYRSLFNAVNSGYESGTYIQMKKAMLDAIDKQHFGTDGIELAVIFSDPQHWLDSDVNICVKITDILEKMEEDDEFEDYIADHGFFNDFEISMSVPRNGFYDYVYKAALESFYEDNPELK